MRPKKSCEHPVTVGISEQHVAPEGGMALEGSCCVTLVQPCLPQGSSCTMCGASRSDALTFQVRAPADARSP